jgi:hypothetical protein
MIRRFIGGAGGCPEDCDPCVNVTVIPAVTIAPVRAAAPVFAATTYWTWPIPNPVAEVTVIQLTVLVAVHVQLEPVLTARALVLAVGATVTLVGVTV